MIRDGQYKVRAMRRENGIPVGMDVFSIAVLNGVISLIRDDKETEHLDLLDPTRLVPLPDNPEATFEYPPGIDAD